MNCDYTGPGGIPLERIAQQQGGTHPAPCARSCEANAYEIQIRQLSSERDAMAAEAAPRVARLTHPDIAKALASAGLKPEDYRDDGEIFPLVVAIESAALRKNGLALED